MTEILPPISHLNDSIPVQNVLHLRESIFIVSYINGLIEMVDFSTPDAEEPLLSFQVPNDDEDPDVEYLRSLHGLDVYGHSEEKLLLCFRDDAIAYLNLPTKEFHVIKRPVTGEEREEVAGTNVSDEQKGKLIELILTDFFVLGCFMVPVHCDKILP